MKTDVLIIGAGPTGLALACQLIRYGVDSVIIDKKETTTPYSKAIGVQARTLEIYEQIGLADKLIGLGAKVEKARMFAGGKVRGEARDGLEVDSPTAWVWELRGGRVCWGCVYADPGETFMGLVAERDGAVSGGGRPRDEPPTPPLRAA